jgi:hypothetical protein
MSRSTYTTELAEFIMLLMGTSLGAGKIAKLIAGAIFEKKIRKGSV